MYKALKKYKKLSCLFFAVLISYLAFCTTVSAADCVYGTWDNDLVQRITVSNFWRDLIRSAGYWILKGIAYLIDMVEDAINEVLSLNIYEGVKEFFNFDSWVYPMASAIFLFCLVGCAIFLMIFYNKGRMSAFLKSIIMASFLIFAFPALISALTDLKDAGVESVSAIDPSGANSSVTHSIGDSILSSITVDMEESGKYGKERYVADTDDYRKKTDIAYNLNINATIDSDDENTPYKWAVDGSEPIAKTYRRYEDLTDENILDLLGIRGDCETLTNLYDNFISSSKSNGTHDISNFTISYGRWIDDEGGHKEWNTSSTRGDDIWYDICYSVYLKLFYDPQIDHTLLEGVVWKTNSSFTLTDEYTMKIETVMNDASDTIRDYKISPSPKSLITKLLSELRSTGIAKQLNTIQNKAESEKDTRYDYTYRKLYTDADLEEDQDWAIDFTVEIAKFLENGFTVTENVYAYDYDFIYGIIVLVCVLICLLSAGIRLVRLLLDIVFMQIIGPIVFASDLQDSGRTKRLLTEVISSFIVIIIVLLLIKLYIIILLWTFRQDISWITKLLLVFGGWRFTIDGPDIVTKICGIDAGIKSGQAALLGAYAAGRTAVGIGRGVGRAAAGAGHAISGGLGGAGKGLASGFNPGSGNGGNYSNPSGGANSASSPPNDTASGSGGGKGNSSGGQPQSGGLSSSQPMPSSSSENNSGGSNVNYSNPAQGNSTSQQGSEGKENKHGMFNTMQQADGVLGKASAAAGYVVGKTAKGAINSVKPKNLGKTAGHAVNAGKKIGHGVKTIKSDPKNAAQYAAHAVRNRTLNGLYSAKDKATNIASKAKQDFSSSFNDTKHTPPMPTKPLKDFSKSDFKSSYNGNRDNFAKTPVSSFGSQSDKLLRNKGNASSTSQNYTPQNYLSNKEIAREINSKLQSPTVKTEKGDKK